MARSNGFGKTNHCLSFTVSIPCLVKFTLGFLTQNLEFTRCLVYIKKIQSLQSSILLVDGDYYLRRWKWKQAQKGKVEKSHLEGM